MKKLYSPVEKAKMVLEVLRGEETISEIASNYNIHPNLLTRWKIQTINCLSQVSENGTAKARKQAEEAEKEKDELYIW